MPANFVPLTNSILAAMAARGVSRGDIAATLQRMGGEVPGGTARMLRAARARGVDLVVVSDCNSVFISHVLASARLLGCVSKIITNPAAFVADGGAADAEQAAPQREQRSRLLIAPRRAAPHGCPRCPENLCKGEELQAVLAAGGFARVVYGGDGANDICPALQLREGDMLLARRGCSLSEFVTAPHGAAAAAGEGAGAGEGEARLRAEVQLWETHDELAALVEKLTSSCGGLADGGQDGGASAVVSTGLDAAVAAAAC
ncbi:hypothetical protein MNEG_10651 [Monoraphidium neglectum]|jgi:2,3-diketo-5-methylthio-1-phosphopentane phosphatase|uniref:Uncharacterized protein n=1 Tax=Monoraphidium neglectum TaxID=145388 RepID=A0A0D2JC97_9CHLO|nr:hypothetical protein MNEG_10651 [Monoraphidium neglectum]KIY97312.1 hypothetical protein MNEG_10651 [Monoraphidium neglectum]|eukprot:XP_013896332.1 hypothetical protein MNEG_10651 [Monoraphidium neglectum]